MKTYRELMERQRRLNEDAPPRTVLHMARKDTGKRESISRLAATAAVAAAVVSLFVIYDHYSDYRFGDVKTSAESEDQAEVENLAGMTPQVTSVREAYTIEETEALLIEADIYRVAIPLSMEEQFALYNASQEFGVDYFLMIALIHRETNFRNIPGDGGDSIGYAQVQPKWWSGLMEDIGAKDLTVPEDNFRTACAILASLTERYGNIEDALTAYNRGKPGSSEYATAILMNAENWRKAGSVDNVDNMEIDPATTFHEE